MTITNVWNTAESIESDIMPRLFSKSITILYHGIGLELSISKIIMEAYGRGISTKNNDDRKVATFVFSQRISNHEDNNR